MPLLKFESPVRTYLQLLLLCLGLMSMSIETATAQESRGHLVIIGGGLRYDNHAIFDSMIRYAGGAEKARFVVLPTASISTRDSHLICDELQHHGLKPGQAEVLEVTEHNAASSTADAAILAKIRAATGLYISGGDQRRLVRALTRPDGSDTPLLAECRRLLERGGLIAGSSAGASGQSEVMLAVSGLPPMLIDEGLDALDYGITADEAQRGLLITRGLGFFKTGIVDQHFFHFRGRLGRLTRAVDECRVPFGFGIDENTALIVEPSGVCRVIGAGFVTIIQPPSQPGRDGPLGYQVKDVWVSVLSDGDSFDPKTKTIKVVAEKPEQSIDKAEYNGNFLINDMNAAGAGAFAIISGLAENQKSRQDGIAIKYHGNGSHGYHYVLSKRPESKAYVGRVNHSWAYSLTNLRLDISPISNGLKPSQDCLPKDLPRSDEKLARALSAVHFRGMINCTEQGMLRPSDSITHAELAHALAHATHLQSTTPEITKIIDVDSETREGESIYSVVAAGLMAVDVKNQFNPAKNASSHDVAHSLRKLAMLDRKQLEPELASSLDKLEKLGESAVPRQVAGRLLHTILRLPE